MRVRFKMSWGLAATFILIVAVASYLGDWFLGVPYWIGLGIIVSAMIANGLLAEWEDSRLGGFFNPTEEHTDRKP